MSNEHNPYCDPITQTKGDAVLINIMFATATMILIGMGIASVVFVGAYHAQ